MSDRTDRYLNFVVTVAVLVAIVAMASRLRPQWFGLHAAAGPQRSLEPVQVANWPAVAAIGHTMGPKEAKVTILEFGDFECPACRKFSNSALVEVRAKYPADVKVVFRHWPLASHRFAYPAARASECAAFQGRFEAIHDLLYKKQDSLGLKSFVEFAREAGVIDLKAFEECNKLTGNVAAIDADSAAARAVGGTGTPTVIINGTLYPGGLSADRLLKLVEEALGK